MNILKPGLGPQEAEVRYLDGDYAVIQPGSFVRCAITNEPIQIDDLKYWNVDKQEAYRSAEAAYQAYEASLND